MGGNNVEARLEWWRRASFILIGVIILGVGAWFGILSAQVQDNHDSIAEIHSDIASLRELVTVSTLAQRDTTAQLAQLTGQIELILRLESAQ